MSRLSLHTTATARDIANLVQGWTTSARSRSGPVQCLGPTIFEMESDRTDRRIDLDRTDFRPISKGQGPTDRSSPCLTIGPDQSVGPIY